MEQTKYDKEKRFSRKKQNEVDTLVYGKVPPQAKELESAVLGAIMLERHAFELVAEILKPESFYVDAHQQIFRAMKKLSADNKPIDELTVAQQLMASGEIETAGGVYYLMQLTKNVVSSANIVPHSHFIREKFLRRELIRLSGNTLNDAYNDEVPLKSLLNEFEMEFTNISMDGTSDNAVMIDQAVVESIRRMEELKAQDQEITGVPSGFYEIDKITHGFQDTDLIILAARPSVGKTALALNLARNAAINKIKEVPVAFFSLEMSTGQLTNRMISAESGIWLEKISNGRFEEDEMKTIYKKGVESLSKAKIIIDDTPALDIHSLKTRCRKHKRQHKIGLIIIDYLQLMSGDTNDSRNREREISQISRGLKQLAKELKIPVIALSQLSRETEKRKGEAKTPQLSDIRESGAIEQDADMVMFLYRPEYYQISANEMGESTAGETHVTIAKHRNGKLAVGHNAIKLRALLHIQKFVPWKDSDSPAAAPSELGPGAWKPVSEINNQKGDGLSF